ncbi:AMP-dependent synthetase and ligase [Novosphingobium aromaticivorans DSM 12444]|uniref:AMP-dependent synthetase and ligase n=1 Tax=Novosphingobium aromaticivorans (strain ATCC 700278 / DSM 12444 / CCUG 56034 / CIP 105152 / NBRC 16084 / F199) TaxID=279238 RepID=Q2G851_NOVAD|nr:acyl-CoA synthetase [Novosphingobium aromaticivorans]ABD25972.1 AMP-dependent synthetase and ligase [Novosphingobium aromaticivorans DSM 12444]SCY62442.1 fatty-acyl-CoA synthase [Novosphingobium aromaticivorans]
MDWNFGDLLDATAANVPGDRPAIIRGDRVVEWGDFDARTNRLARAMLAAGLPTGARVAILARNIPEFIEIAAAAFKARLAHVNLNYRYTTSEIEYVLRDCQAAAIFYQDEFAPVVAPLINGSIDHLSYAVQIGDGGAYDDIVTIGDPEPLGIERSPDDGYLLYTGGTTGRPKGVMWRAADARQTQLESPVAVTSPASMDDHVAQVLAGRAGRVMPACPLMHGAGLTSSLAELLIGGTVVLLPSNRFSALELWEEASRNRVTRILIVGDAFARPMADTLAANRERWNLDSLRLISSGGLMWSQQVKEALLEALPGITLLDTLGASEASGFGYAITTKDRATPTGLFEPAPHTVLIDPDRDRVLGSDEAGKGWLARRPPFASGYHGDPVKTASVYRIIDGERLAVPGDMAERLPDGRLRLLGRDSMCVNTGGEKVFVEEVEEALKRVNGVADAMVFGLPDPKWGSVVTALIEAGPSPDDEVIRTALSHDLAAYKQPRTIIRVAVLPRHANGKSDYRTGMEIAQRQIATGPSAD